MCVAFVIATEKLFTTSISSFFVFVLLYIALKKIELSGKRSRAETKAIDCLLVCERREGEVQGRLIEWEKGR